MILSGGTTASENGVLLTVELTPADLTAVKLDNRLCTDFTNCYINLPDGTVLDMAQNRLQAVIDMATTFIFDTSGPELIEFSLDLNSGQFSMTFNEPVEPNTRDFSAITLQNAVEATVQYQLSGGNLITSGTNPFIDFSLLPEDLNNIKSIDNLASSIDNTYIAITNSLIDDVFNLDNIPLLDGVNATQVSVYTQDLAPANLVGFSYLDLNLGRSS